jgi:FdhE protein
MSTVAPLDQLARADPTVAPLARLQSAALAAAEDHAWEAGVPELDWSDSGGDLPLLHGVTLRVEVDRLRRLLITLARTLRQSGVEHGATIAMQLDARRSDALELTQASLRQDHARLEELARASEVEPAALAVVTSAASLPILLACGRQAASAVAAARWDSGYCPVCAAWPTLAEVRGLERELFLRCGRCASAWRFEHSRCPFCGTREGKTQKYFAAEQERETRRAMVCESCRGYFKTLATLGPLAPAELLARDMETLELDVTVLEQDYRRPDRPGWQLELTLEPVRAGSRWFNR